MNQYHAQYPNLRGAVMTVDPFDGIVLSRDNEVKRQGYRSANDQINELTKAGIKLQLSREDQYAEPTGLNNVRHYGEIDRTIADMKLTRIKEDVVGRKNERLKARADEARRKQEELAAPEEASQKGAKGAKDTTPEGGVT